MPKKTVKKTKEKKTSGFADYFVAESLKIGDFNQNSLTRLVEIIISRVGEASVNAQAFVHLPKDMIDELNDKLKLSKKPRANNLYTCNRSPRSKGKVVFKPVGLLPQRHPLLSELLVILAGESICAMISAWRDSADSNMKVGQPNWKVAISFVPEGVLSSIKSINSFLKHRSSKNTSVQLWLDNAKVRIQECALNGDTNSTWGKHLPDFILDIERKRLERENELKWFQLISRIQDAVGWELDTGKLFAAISQVLKNTLGFHYLEVQILEARGKKFDVTAVHHRNDTAFGGKLLTVILRSEVQRKILNSRRPMLIGSADAEDTLMNPRLMKYMTIESGIIIPLVYHKRVNGLLKLFSRNKNHFSREDLAGMETIGRILARSIENVKLHSMMKRMATVDGLTNLYNRRFFNEQMVREFKRSQRYSSNLTLIMIDIDHFKNYNDLLGHLRGDQILITVSQLLKKCVREVDIVTRYGGEEFAIILPEANLDHGMLVAEKIRSEVEAYSFKYENRQPGGRLTLSLGVASNSAGVDTINELINRADVALYRAKKTGRNRCEAYKSS
ncbi:sensor domain-containing diguanylate cyclase [bacterium]|nr:sensor domain-containing diguanylate cyclase [bacterium]